MFRVLRVLSGRTTIETDKKEDVEENDVNVYTVTPSETPPRKGETPPPIYEEPAFNQSTHNEMKFVQVIENSLNSESLNSKQDVGHYNDAVSLGGETEESFHSIKSDDQSSIIANLGTKDSDSESINDFKSLKDID